MLSRAQTLRRNFTVVVAISANLVIMLAKLAAAVISGSAAMLAEAAHSIVDVANQGVILFGIWRSRRPADRNHPFGYGKEVYFWTLIYAMLLFGVAGGVSIYEGISRLLAPSRTSDFAFSYVVLAVALVAESVSWFVAVRAVDREGRGASFFQKLLGSKDPSRFVVVGEDTAAIAGVLVAFLGLSLTQITGSPYPDAVASIGIGLLLCASAIYLTVHTRRLLVGESIDDDLLRQIRALTLARRDVEDTGDAFTMHLGPDTILVAIDVRFRGDLSGDQVAFAVDEIEAAIRRLDARVERIFVEAQLSAQDIEQPERLDEAASATGLPAG